METSCFVWLKQQQVNNMPDKILNGPITNISR